MKKCGIYICLKIFFIFNCSHYIINLHEVLYFYIFIYMYLAAISFVIRKLKSQKNSDILTLYLKAMTYSDNVILPQHVGSRPELKS